MGVVHVWRGAATGSMMPNEPAALAAGVASHVAGDMTPHKDGWPALDTLATIASLACIGGRFGYGSKEFVGALGGLAPDLEHVARKAGHPLSARPIFPTHNRRLPHPRSHSYWSQLAVGSLSALFLLWRRWPAAGRKHTSRRDRRALPQTAPALAAGIGVRELA